MNEITLTAFSCSILAALRYLDESRIKIFRVFCTSMGLTLFLGEDSVNFVQFFFSFEISHGGTICILAFVGTELLEKMLLVIKTFNINKLWK